jgi:large subunit ribosomal protein L23
MGIIKSPILTEKMVDQTDKYNRYGFVVDLKATKPQIKKAIEDLYGVDVVSVRTMIYPAKTKLKYTKRGLQQSKKGAYKKAIVELKEGQSIDFFNL